MNLMAFADEGQVGTFDCFKWSTIATTHEFIEQTGLRTKDEFNQYTLPELMQRLVDNLIS